MAKALLLRGNLNAFTLQSQRFCAAMSMTFILSYLDSHGGCLALSRIAGRRDARTLTVSFSRKPTSREPCRCGPWHR